VASAEQMRHHPPGDAHPFSKNTFWPEFRPTKVLVHNEREEGGKREQKAGNRRFKEKGGLGVFSKGRTKVASVRTVRGREIAREKGA